MTSSQSRMQTFIENINKYISIDNLEKKLKQKHTKTHPRLKHAKILTSEIIKKNWSILKNYSPASNKDQELIADEQTLKHIKQFSNNIENCIGTIKLPVGVIGPLRINGLFAQGDYYVPLATTEAALVASYNRGSALITQSGGCSSLVLNDGVCRSPGFIFNNLIEVGQFINWINNNLNSFFKIPESTTKYGKLIDISCNTEGRHVYLIFDFYTGNAAGQNMVTIATDAICQYILKNSPVQPVHFLIEANFSGDKKACALSFQSVRGKKVTAEVHIPAELVEKYFHTNSKKMVEFWEMAAYGAIMSGAIGVQAHYANGLAALYLATGQDVACVAESSVGITKLQLKEKRDLYASVTLPNIIVGTVGGGTKLPSQNSGINITGVNNTNNSSYAFAELCAAVCLAGELSLIGAISANDFTKAHSKLARGK